MQEDENYQLPLLVNIISQKHLAGISLNFAQWYFLDTRMNLLDFGGQKVKVTGLVTIQKFIISNKNF